MCLGDCTCYDCYLEEILANYYTSVLYFDCIKFVFYLSIPTFLETRFKFVTFKLDKQGLARDTWQRMIDLSGERFFMIDPISARTASDMLHKLTYEPISCTSVRVGANELDEIRAVTIHFDSICICGGFSVCPY